MSGRFPTRSLFLFFLLLGRPGLSAAQTLGGMVLDRTTGEPLDSVRVVIFDSKRGLLDSTMTEADGRWQYLLQSSVWHRPSTSPSSFWVSPFYPNPFMPTTSLTVLLSEAGPVHIVVHDILGRKVDEQSLFLPAGKSSLLWDGRGAPGLYVATISACGQKVHRKMVQLGHGTGRGLALLPASSPSPSTELVRLNLESISIAFSKFAYVPDTVVAFAESCSSLVTHLETVHAHAIVIDLHNDVLSKVAEGASYHLGELHSYNHTDIPRLLRGGIDVQVFAIWIDPERYARQAFTRAMEYMGLWQTEVAQNTDRLAHATNSGEIYEALEAGRIAGLLAVEGGHVIENSLAKLRALYEAGVRVLTITWNNSTDWAVSAADPHSATVGLSPFGREVIALMDSLGMLIDVSHTGEQTIRDVLAVTRNPIIASHSGAWALRAHTRNLKDEQIRAIATTGGVIGVVFYPSFLAPGGQNVDVNTVAAHIDYIARLVGIDHVALGSDYDGIERTPRGLEDCAHLPNLTWTLLRRGYSSRDIDKVLGGNFLRVFTQVCQRAGS